MNTKKYYRQLTVITVLAILCSIVWIYYTFGKCYAIFATPPIVSEDYKVLPYIMACGYALFAAILVFTLLWFLYNQLHSLKNGVIFSKRCQKSLFAWGIFWPFYDLCATNMPSCGEVYDTLEIQGSFVGITIIILTFAILYKIARQVAEENQLTI